MPTAISSSTLALGLGVGLVLDFFVRRDGGVPACALTMSCHHGHVLDRAWWPAWLQRIHLNMQSHFIRTLSKMCLGLSGFPGYR